MILKYYKKRVTTILVVFFILNSFCFSAMGSVVQDNNTSAKEQIPILIVLGDSIGEGVQSVDASGITQLSIYSHLLAWRSGDYLTLPLIQTNPLGVVGNTANRTRLQPYKVATNLAVSGADVHSLLYDQADALSEEEIDSETDLVLFPLHGSQMEIAEYISGQVGEAFMVCWIGNNDVLSAVVSFDQLDASQMTTVAQFETDFTEIVQRLHVLGNAAVFANIPNVTRIGFLVDRQDLIKFLGSDYGLQEGDYTSIVVLFLIKLGLDNGSLIGNPDFVLDANEVQQIQQRTDAFNGIIADTAGMYNYPLVDINALFDEMAAAPLTFMDIPVTDRFLGGLFSLDGVHPSNIGHALIANAFIERINTYYGVDIPPMSQDILDYIFFTDPFVDKDADNRVKGRFGKGLLETLGPIIGISGDINDFVRDPYLREADENTGKKFMERYYRLKGREFQENEIWSKGDVINAFKDIFEYKTFADR